MDRNDQLVCSYYLRNKNIKSKKSILNSHFFPQKKSSKLKKNPFLSSNFQTVSSPLMLCSDSLCVIVVVVEKKTSPCIYEATYEYHNACFENFNVNRENKYRKIKNKKNPEKSTTMSGESESLRIKLVLSVLSGKPLKLKNIRQEEDEPGLAGKKL